MRVQSGPLLWIFLLAAPIILGFLISLRSEQVDTSNPVQEIQNSEQTKTQAQSQPDRKSEIRRRQGSRGSVGQENLGSVDCDFSPWIGLPVDADMQAVLRTSNRPFRVLPPGAMMTMDHSPARVNFDLDAGGIITRVWCG